MRLHSALPHPDSPKSTDEAVNEGAIIRVLRRIGVSRSRVTQRGPVPLLYPPPAPAPALLPFSRCHPSSPVPCSLLLCLLPPLSLPGLTTPGTSRRSFGIVGHRCLQLHGMKVTDTHRLSSALMALITSDGGSMGLTTPGTSRRSFAPAMMPCTSTSFSSLDAAASTWDSTRESESEVIRAIVLENSPCSLHGQ